MAMQDQIFPRLTCCDALMLHGKSTCERVAKSGMAAEAQKDTKVSLDKEVFWSRLKQCYTAWSKGGKMWAEADACVLVYGLPNEEVNYSKSTAMELSLLGSLCVLCNVCVWGGALTGLQVRAHGQRAPVHGESFLHSHWSVNYLFLPKYTNPSSIQLSI
jgi:hypothetical protein